MNEKDRLVELLCTAGWNLYTNDCNIGQIADHLIAHNVTIPPVSVGQTVYLIRRPFHHEPYISDEVVERVRIEYTKDGILRRFGNRSFEAYDIDLGETVFLTRESAERALEERSESNA